MIDINIYALFIHSILTDTSFTTAHSHPSLIAIMAKNEVDGSWISMHRESTFNWAGNEVKKQIMFNNPNSVFEYRLVFMKKASTKKLEISDCDIINRIISSLTAETYYKITGTMLFSPSTVQPKEGFVIGMVNNPSKNFMVSVNITPRGKVSGYDYSNIYCFRDDPTQSGIHNALLGLDVGELAYQIYSWINGPHGYKEAFFLNSLAENVTYAVATKVFGDYMTLYVDGAVVATTEVKYADRKDFTKLYALVSNNMDPPANADVKGLRFINLKNDK